MLTPVTDHQFALLVAALLDIALRRAGREMKPREHTQVVSLAEKARHA